MSLPSPDAGDQDGTLSHLAEAAARRQWVRLAGWSTVLILASFASCKCMTMTVTEMLTVLVPKRPGLGLPQPMIASKRATIVTKKLEPTLLESEAALERWLARTSESEDVIRALAKAEDEFHSVLETVANLQISLAESRSVGSTVGLQAGELEQAQGELREESATLHHHFEEVELQARQLSQENPVAEIQMESASAESMNPERRRRRDALEAKVAQGAADVGHEKLIMDVRNVEKMVASSVTMQEAESMAKRVIDATKRSVSAGAYGNEGLSDEDISEIVKEELLSAKTSFDSLTEGCVTVSTARNITRMALERYASDGTGMVDYALGLTGAAIVEHMTSETFEPTNVTPLEKVRNLARTGGHQSVAPPVIAIYTDSRLARCWPMQGSQGRLTVALSEVIMVESISLEHASREILLNGGISAPKHFSVIGYRPDWVPGGSTVGDVLLSGAQYLLDGDVIQYFTIDERYRGMEYMAVTLEVESNHGEQAYTCLYRLRVHGTSKEAA